MAGGPTIERSKFTETVKTVTLGKYSVTRGRISRGTTCNPKESQQIGCISQSASNKFVVFIRFKMPTVG